LDSAEKKEEKKCSDIMKPHVITLSKKSKVREAVEIMKRRSISQIPIVEKDHMIGSISEAKIYDLLSENSKEKIFEKRIEEIMEEPFPTLNKTSPISLVMPLLKFSNALIITQQGKIIGIVTKSDVI
jgi:predicted transcriptional regulator